MTPNPAPGSVWWTDGTHVLPMTTDEIAGWLARGVAYGWVVTAPSADVALARGRALAASFRWLKADQARQHARQR